MVIWGTFFIESWKRRENELSYCWDMHYFKKREQPRVMYQGKYHINKFSSEAEVYDKFTTFYRRLIMDGPIILIGIASVVACFFLV
jgi:Calcium-activated chloride channel